MEPTMTLITLNPGRVELSIGVFASTGVSVSFCLLRYLVDDGSLRWRVMKRGGRFLGHFKKWDFLGLLAPMIVALDL